MINCRKLTKLTTQFHLKTLAGKSGMNRVISWFHYIENPDYMDWLRGNEMVLTTGMFFDQNIDKMRSFITNLYERDAAGLIINLSPYIRTIPKEVIELGDFLGFPIFEMPAEVRIIDISECICTAIIESSAKQNMTEHFLFSLIYEKVSISEKTIQKAIRCGYNPEQAYYTIVFDLEVLHPGEGVTDEDVYIRLLKSLEGQLKTLYQDTYLEVLFFSNQNQLTLLYPVNDEKDIKDKIQTLCDNFMSKNPHCRLSVGISPKWQHLSQLRIQYEKAQNAIKIHPILAQPSSIVFYDDLDIYALLFLVKSSSELTNLYMKSLGKIIDPDENEHTELVQTLEKYIEENGNLIKAAAGLFIHVNTLRYRLRKIEQLLDCDLKDSETLFRLNLSIKIRKYLSVITPSEDVTS